MNTRAPFSNFPKTLRTTTFINRNTPNQNGKVRKGFIFEKRFPNKIEIDQYGLQVNSLKVVLNIKVIMPAET